MEVELGWGRAELGSERAGDGWIESRRGHNVAHSATLLTLFPLLKNTISLPLCTTANDQRSFNALVWGPGIGIGPFYKQVQPQRFPSRD